MKAYKKLRRKYRRFMHWFTDTEVYWSIRKVGWRISDLNNWVKYRTTRKYNVIKIRSLSPGYHCGDTLMLHGMFELLVDLVELEKANMLRVSDGPTPSRIGWFFKYYVLPDVIYDLLYYRRSRELGLKYLDWERSLPKENVLNEAGEVIEFACPWQAEAAEELRALYLWWKDIRPIRPCPMDASGWSEICREREEKGEGLFERSKAVSWDEDGIPTSYSCKPRKGTPEEEARTRAALDKSNEIETAYDKEDEEMLIRLVKVRNYLCT